MHTPIHLQQSADGIEQYTMPCAEALLADTLALMTGHVQACCDGRRELMAKKIVSSLFFLAEHPLLSPQFKTMLWNLRTRWEVQVENCQVVQPTERDQRLWHVGPQVVQ